VARRDRSTGRNTIGDLSDPALISTLTGWLEGSGASALEITTPDGGVLKIVLETGTRAVRVAEVAPERPTGRPEGRALKVPMAGLFRDRHPAAFEAEPLAGEGRALEAGALAGFVEIGPVLLPVIASEAGVIGEIHARTGDLIGYGDTVLMMEPA
jgi:acetyl-CoA carboxylase biotin carboxyl carrier protein